MLALICTLLFVDVEPSTGLLFLDMFQHYRNFFRSLQTQQFVRHEVMIEFLTIGQQLFQDILFEELLSC